jgi:Na+/H+ antiporter NhaC
MEPFWLLVQSLPFRFYNWFMLLLVFLVVWLMRDWGPMHHAEKAASSRRVCETEELDPPAQPGSIALALVPLGVLVVGIPVGLFIDGGGAERPFTFQSWVQAFGAANAARVFVLATAVASGVAMGLSAVWARSGRSRQSASRDAFLAGMQHMFLPALILVFAWMLNSVIKDLGTAGYLVSLLSEQLAPGALPALVFVLASVISFSTGTSWGTMAIVMPLVIPVAAELGGLGQAGAVSTVFVATIGAVLAGAVFGDHCSPISDTTVVSSFSCDCDVMAHVRTQLPYALMAGTIAVLMGYGPAGFGVSPWLLLPVGGLSLWGLVRFTGRSTGMHSSVSWRSPD